MLREQEGIDFPMLSPTPIRLVLRACVSCLFALTWRLEKLIIERCRVSRLESFVQFPVPQITTLALLVHAALGCCWHHGHACVPKVNASTPTAVGVCQGHFHCDSHGRQGEDQSDDTSYPSDDDSHDHQCEGSDCTFLATEASPEQRGELGFDLCPFDSVASATASVALPLQPLSQADHRDFYATAPLRAHLLFSVLLI